MQSSDSNTSLFKHELDEGEWQLVAKYSDRLNEEYAQRAQMILKRLDATVESFTWSDRLKKKEPEIKAAYDKMKPQLISPLPVTLEDLIKATTGRHCDYFISAWNYLNL